jgi:hypothetical protein
VSGFSEMLVQARIKTLEFGDGSFFRNVGIYLPVYTAPHLRIGAVSSELLTVVK